MICNCHIARKQMKLQNIFSINSNGHVQQDKYDHNFLNMCVRSGPVTFTHDVIILDLFDHAVNF